MFCVCLSRESFCLCVVLGLHQALKAAVFMETTVRTQDDHSSVRWGSGCTGHEGAWLAARLANALHSLGRAVCSQ